MARPLDFYSRLELERAIMNREKTLRYVLIAVVILILALLALQFWVVKNKKYFFQGSVAVSVGPVGRSIVLPEDLQERRRLRQGVPLAYPCAVPAWLHHLHPIEDA